MSGQSAAFEERRTRTVSGGGDVSFTVEHRNEDTGRALASKIDTTIEMMNARYFNQEPRQRSGTKMANTEYELHAISEAIDDANDCPTFTKNVDGELEYVVEDAYYPDDYAHYVDVTDIPAEDRSRAFLTAQSALCRHGYAINSIRTDEDGLLTKFHVVSLTWVYDARSYGRQQEGE